MALARAKSYIYVGGLPPTTLRRSRMGLLDAHVRSPLSIPVVGPERRNATHTTSGLALFDWPRSVDRGAPTASRWLVPGRHGGVIRPTSIGAAQETRHRASERLRQACQPVLSTSATSVWRASESSQTPKTRKARLSFANASIAQRSCGALIELLV